MLLRLSVKGFKNIKDAEIRFGPLTCFVGSNGVGKSNVFDAIHFLAALADNDIQTAAQMVRSASSGDFGPQELFWNGNLSIPISFEMDMLVPRQVSDDFGRETEPATTLLQYCVEFRCVGKDIQRLVLSKEELKPLKAGEARKVIGFKHHADFRNSVIKSTRRKGPFISTATEGSDLAITIHKDGGSRGQGIPAGKSPRTVIGGTNAVEYPTVLAAKREMASWQTLHLEPSIMRTPDRIGGASVVDVHGGHVASAINRLVEQSLSPDKTLTSLANQLSTLVPDVKAIRVDRDEARQQLVVKVQMKGCESELGPRSLSDGTLRFLALVAMEAEQNRSTVLCFEEPENGMHPGRIPSMVELLKNYTVDPDLPAGEDNPLRQVIINTHSPDVVRQLKPSDLLFVETVDSSEGKYAQITHIEKEWRGDERAVTVQKMVDFIGGSPLGEEMEQLRLDFGIGSLR